MSIHVLQRHQRLREWSDMGHTDTIKDDYEAAEQNMLTRQAATNLDDNQQPARLVGEHLNSDEAGHETLAAL